MKATIKTTNQTLTGKTLKDIRKQMNAMLKIEGPRGLTAVTDSGAEIHVELHEGQDYIRYANGHIAK